MTFLNYASVPTNNCLKLRLVRKNTANERKLGTKPRLEVRRIPQLFGRKGRGGGSRRFLQHRKVRVKICLVCQCVCVCVGGGGGGGFWQNLPTPTPLKNSPPLNTGWTVIRKRLLTLHNRVSKQGSRCSLEIPTDRRKESKYQAVYFRGKNKQRWLMCCDFWKPVNCTIWRANEQER